VNIADQFQKIRIFFTDNRFIAVLEKVAASFVAFIEGNSITCHKAAHDLTERGWSRPQKEMEMVGDQRPCITLGLGLFEDKSRAFQKGFSVLVVPEDFTAFNSSSPSEIR